MAKKTNRAIAQPSVKKSGKSSSKAGKASPSTLVFRAADEVENLREVLLAYTGLEKLISPVGVHDVEEICSSRSELSALMILVNEELHRRIEIAYDAIRVAHTAVR